MNLICGKMNVEKKKNEIWPASFMEFNFVTKNESKKYCLQKVAEKSRNFSLFSLLVIYISEHTISQCGIGRK